MIQKLIFRLAVPVVCLALAANAPQADAQSIAPSGKQAAAIFAILIGVGVGVGVGIYYLVRAPHNITGCVSNGDEGLQLTDERAKSRYLLSGEVAAIKSGRRVRLSGKPGKGANKRKSFTVSKVSQDYGACNVTSALP